MASDEKYGVDGAKLRDRLGFTLACNGLDIGTAEIDIDWCGDEEGWVAKSWRREQLSRENTPAVRGQQELADERIHLLLLGMSISRDRNRGGTAAWDTGILCKVPPIRANAVARIEHVLKSFTCPEAFLLD